jgi:hypothetical protein
MSGYFDFADVTSQKLSSWLSAYTDFINAEGANPDLLAKLPTPDSWEFRALAAMHKAVFRGVLTERIQGRSDFYTLGYSAGVLESAIAFAGDDIDELPDELFNSIKLPVQFDQALKEKDLKAIVAKFHEPLVGASLSEKADYYSGLVAGMSALCDDVDLKHETDASEAYTAMLIHSEQIGLLESWKDFHAFICEHVNGYVNRFDACKKMGQAVGYSPQAEFLKRRANRAGGA